MDKDATKLYFMLAIMGMVAGLALMAVLGLVPVGLSLSANDTEEISVSISVAETTAIDVSPNTVSWSDLYPGYEGANASLSSSWVDVGIQNIGSNTITKIWANASMPSTDPYASANPSDFDAAMFVAIRNETGSKFYLIQSKEFNETLPDYVVLHTATNTTMTGKIRVGFAEYYFQFDDTTNDGCHNGTIYISTTPKTNSSDGDYDLSDNTGITVNPNDGDSAASFGVADITLSGTTQGVDETYCLAVARDCTYLIISKWNKDIDETSATGAGTSDCSNDWYLFDGSLEPSNTTNIKLAPRVPYGVPAGTLGAGTVTILAADW